MARRSIRGYEFSQLLRPATLHTLSPLVIRSHEIPEQDNQPNPVPTARNLLGNVALENLALASIGIYAEALVEASVETLDLVHLIYILHTKPRIRHVQP